MKSTSSSTSTSSTRSPSSREARTVNFAGQTIRAGDLESNSSDSEAGTHEQAPQNPRTSTSPVNHDFVEPDFQPTATCTVIADLSECDGEDLAEQIDSLVEAHPVVMFNKTWCLFSKDAQYFLMNQMGVSIHSVEVDVHPQGKEILKIVQAKTNHSTVPVVFIKGDFLGGFEDVNRMYATGELESFYLQGLTQADQCEEFFSKSSISKKPLLWFPETVNGHVVRVTGILTCLASTVSAIGVFWFDWMAYVAYAIFVDFVFRFIAGSKLSVFGRLATIIASALEPKPRSGRPKQFASACGLVFSFLGSFFYLLSFPYHNIVGTVFIGGLACATGMEGFLDFCLGCLIFKYGIKLGIISK